jgi:hypothetical protein
MHKILSKYAKGLNSRCVEVGNVALKTMQLNENKNNWTKCSGDLLYRV